VEGALDSAWRAVNEMLVLGYPGSYRDKFYKNWGKNPEWIAPASGIILTDVPEPDEDLVLQHLKYTNPEYF